MTARSLGFAALGLAALLVGLALLNGGRPPEVEANETLRASPELARPVDPAPLAAQPPDFERVSGRPELRVVRLLDKDPLPGATATWVARSTDRSTLTDAAFGEADARGAVPWVPPRNGEDLLLVRASGYVPRLVSGPFLGPPGEVELSEAAVLEISFVDTAGRLIPGVRAMLGARFWSELGAMDDPVGIGHPLSQSPLWRYDSTEAGMAQFSELPPGEYYLNVIHGSMVPVGSSGSNARLHLFAGKRRETIAMIEGHGALVQVPSDSPVRRIVWKPPHELLARGIDVARRLPVLRETLGGRFPEAMAYAHVLVSPEDRAEISCQVALEDGSLWRGRCELLPLTKIDAPLFLERWDVPTRRITLLVSDKTGRSYPGIAFSLLNQEQPFDLVSGTPAVVAHGTYELACTLNMRTFSQFFRRKVVVDDASPDLVTLELGEPVTRVSLNVRYPGPQVLGVCSFKLRVDGSIAGHRASYRPTSPALEFWLQGKELTVELGSELYKSTRLGPFQLDPDKALEIDVPLEVAETKR